MTFSFYPYSLTPRNLKLNSQTQVVNKQGVLLKFSENDKFTYADFHCDEDFMSMSLFDLKNYFNAQKLSELQQSSQWKQSLKLADCMGRSAAEVKSLNAISSHYLIQDVLSFDPLQLLRLETLKFDRFKVKMGRSLRAETEALKKLMNKSDYTTKFRLDFNESIAKKEFIIWLEKNNDILQKKVDFIEDPIKWDSNQWAHIQNKYNVSLALDMATNPMELSDKDLPHILVLKPAVQDVDSIVEKFAHSEVRFVVTHYMDHPVGQLGANYFAQKLKSHFGERVLSGGLMGFEMFENHEFSEIKFSGQSTVPTKVFGKESWGMNFILNKLDWMNTSSS